MKRKHDPHSDACASTPPLAHTGGCNVSWFTRFARWTSFNAGRPSTFLVALVFVVGWALSGPFFNFSETWQLFINTLTTIATFLMVFLIQNAQNRDSQAIHLKLDELIRAKKGARNALLDLDDLSDEELASIRSSFVRIAAEAKNVTARVHEAKDAPQATGVVAIVRAKTKG